MRLRQACTLVSLLLLTMAGAMGFVAAAAQETGATLTVELQEFDGSGISGTAVLTETTTGGTHVSMQLLGQQLDGNHPTHIHTGTCDNFDPEPLYPLQTINLSPVSQEGLSESDVEEASLASLRDGEFVILVHQSPEELTTYLVCGEIGGGVLGVGPRVVPGEDSAAAHHVPSTGVGAALAGGRPESSLPMTFLMLAVLAGLGATALRRYQALPKD